MAEPNLLDRVKRALGVLAVEVQGRKPNQVFILVPYDQVLTACKAMMELPGVRYATCTGIDTRDAIEVLYHFCFDAEKYVVTLKTAAPKPFPQMDSVTPIIPAAEWIEREIMDLLPIKFRNHPRPERLILSDNWPEGVHPLRRDYRHGS